MKTTTLIFFILLGGTPFLPAQNASMPPRPGVDANVAIKASNENEVIPSSGGEGFEHQSVRIYALGFAFAGCTSEGGEKRQRELLTLAGDIMKMADPEADRSEALYLCLENKILVVKTTPSLQALLAEMVNALKENARMPSGQDKSEVCAYSLDFAANGDAATLKYADLRDLLEQVRELGGESDISLHVGERAVIVKGTRDQLQGIDELVEAMRKKVSPDPAVRSNPQLPQ